MSPRSGAAPWRLSEHEAPIAGIPYLCHLGVELLELSDCRARMALTLQPWMLNSWGVAQPRAQGSGHDD